MVLLGESYPFQTILYTLGLCIFPVFIMTLIQNKPSLSPILKGLFFAVVSKFVGEPLFLWLGFYVMKHWHIYYSFPIYFIIYLLAHKMSTVSSFEPIK